MRLQKKQKNYIKNGMHRSKICHLNMTAAKNHLKKI